MIQLGLLKALSVIRYLNSKFNIFFLLIWLFTKKSVGCQFEHILTYFTIIISFTHHRIALLFINYFKTDFYYAKSFGMFDAKA